MAVLTVACVPSQSQKLPVDNTCALMAMLISVNSSPKRFSEKSIIKLGDIILSYMINIALVSVYFASLFIYM